MEPPPPPDAPMPLPIWHKCNAHVRLWEATFNVKRIILLETKTAACTYISQLFVFSPPLNHRPFV